MMLLDVNLLFHRVPSFHEIYIIWIEIRFLCPTLRRAATDRPRILDIGESDCGLDSPGYVGHPKSIERTGNDSIIVDIALILNFARNRATLICILSKLNGYFIRWNPSHIVPHCAMFRVHQIHKEMLQILGSRYPIKSVMIYDDRFHGVLLLQRRWNIIPDPIPRKIRILDQQRIFSKVGDGPFNRMAH